MIKECLTILLDHNMDGSEKVTFLVIGKAKPQCFKNVKTVFCHYEFKIESWMTIPIYEKNLKKLDAKMKKEKKEKDYSVCR